MAMAQRRCSTIRISYLDRTYSTGLACHTTLDAATYSGLCELIERDAYSCYWLTGALLPKSASKS
ncbi:YcaO-like family protein [Aeromonas salmonicida]|uniref:YcaO-like family protein n=2 Tax=Aeromonas salmonicida TaxID=645 RepID=UPI000B58F0BC|nr:hypothetical protein CE456_01520 [Aeromonas salmonicida]QOI95057.1 YcaO-like family protein [Aeromonas salmonicida subsp. masoucida]ASI23462.1 hypothetical protein CE456_13125 [Aeromonas salmonicida]ASI25913.1 hypothetical protein CE463_01845 [Aeromonas salmonicida]ASI27778.1 hypothetical protein CE463_13150 [Aeromonas salmonicida]